MNRPVQYSHDWAPVTWRGLTTTSASLDDATEAVRDLGSAISLAPAVEAMEGVRLKLGNEPRERDDVRLEKTFSVRDLGRLPNGLYLALRLSLEPLGGTFSLLA